MKKIILAGSLSLLSFSALAANDAGCGLGTMVFEGKEGIGPNVLAATTNGSSGNQTFGMSTGTLGCDANQQGFWAVNTFLDSNLDKVARDMSRGEGEALESLATIMKISTQDRAAFYEMAKSNFDQIFPTSTTTRAQVVDALAKVMLQDSKLAKYAPLA